MKRYLDFILEKRSLRRIKWIGESKFVDVTTLTDEQLDDRIDSLSTMINDLSLEIGSLNKEKKRRKEIIENDKFDKLPKSIFDLSKEDFQWAMEHSHGTSEARYKIMQYYARQLTGFSQMGFHKDTNQAYFSFSVYHLEKDGGMISKDSEEFKNILKSFRILSKNSKKDFQGRFIVGITYRHRGDYHASISFIDDELILNFYPTLKININSDDDIYNMLKEIYERDYE